MKPNYAIKFEVGITLPLHDRELPLEQLLLLSKLADSGDRFAINTGLSNKALDLMGAAYRDPRLNTGPPLHLEKCRFENGLGVTKYNGVYAELIKVCETLADEIDLPILVNVKITPDLARELLESNEKPFVMTSCHVMNGSLSLDLRGEPPQKNEFWMDDPTIEVPKFKNEPCVNPDIPPFKNEYDVKKPGDVIVPGVTLKQLQDKALAYDSLKKKYEDTVVTGGKMMDAVEKYKRIEILIENTILKSQNPDEKHTDVAEFISDLVDIIEGKEEPEQFTEGDYRDE